MTLTASPLTQVPVGHSRALCVLAHPLSAHDNGVVLRARALMTALAPRWDITCLHTGLDDDDGTAVPLVRTVGVGTGLPPNLRGWTDTCAPLREALDVHLRQLRPHLVLLWPGAEQSPTDAWEGAVTVADRIDALSLQWWRLLPHARSPRQLVRSLRELSGYVRTEHRIMNSFDVVVVVAEPDANAMRALGGTSELAVLPNGVYSDEAPSLTRSGAPVVAFSGVLDFPPNVQAIEWMANDVWPLVRRELPLARFRIIGRRPLPAVLRLAKEPGVELHENVPSMPAALRAAHVAVAPMLSGSGIKNKILEAWGVATPVVMTSLGAGGIKVPSQAAEYVVNDAATFASRIVHLISDERTRAEVARASWQAVMECHAWPALAARLEALIATRLRVVPRRAE